MRFSCSTSPIRRRPRGIRENGSCPKGVRPIPPGRRARSAVPWGRDQRSRGELPLSQTADRSNLALAGSRELFETVLRNLHEGILVVSAGGEWLYANDEAARLTGYPSADALMGSPRGEAATRFQIFDVDGAPLSL